MTTSILLLALSLLSAAGTANAFRPLYRPFAVATWSFFNGWLTAELALHCVACQAALAGPLVAFGALDAWPGVAGLAALALSWAGLVVCWLRGAPAGRRAHAALRETLGERWEADARPELLERIPRPSAWRWVAPFALRRREVEAMQDVPFATCEDGTVLRLDLFRHRSRPSGCPALLFAHGGGWALGYKERQGLPLLYGLAAQGWVCVSIDYRLSPRATFPDHLVDVKRGIAWLREHGAEHGADPGFLVATGNSAGGHLASLAALTPNDPEYQPGFERVDTTVSACVSFYGVYDLADRDGFWPDRRAFHALQRLVMKKTPEDDPAAFDKASPVARVSADAPPFLIVHGSCDALVPVRSARAFAGALREASRNAVVYAEIPGGQHAFDVFHSPRADLTLDAVFRFLAWLRSRRGGDPAGHCGPWPKGP